MPTYSKCHGKRYSKCHGRCLANRWQTVWQTDGNTYGKAHGKTMAPYPYPLPVPTRESLAGFSLPRSVETLIAYSPHNSSKQSNHELVIAGEHSNGGRDATRTDHLPTMRRGTRKTMHEPVDRRALPIGGATHRANTRGGEAMTAMNESDWQRRVIDAARAHGWRVHHTRTVRLPSGRHATPLQGHRGFPDLTLARDGVVILAELKQDGRYPEPEQRAWRDAIGRQWRLWRPKDWPEVLETLSARRPASPLSDERGARTHPDAGNDRNDLRAFGGDAA